ncbi:MAG: ComEC/Rec2 family competence protein [Pirellulales bacterium]|nr:ComEC/Rec2 family competence protein [Pirellulales bacterium]
MSGELLPAVAAEPNRGGVYRPLVATALAVAAGVVVDRLGEASASAGMRAAFAGSATTILLVLATSLKRVGKQPAIWCLLAALAGTGAVRHAIGWSLARSDDLARFARVESQPACLRAVLVDSPRIAPPPANSLLRALPQGHSSEATIAITAIRDGVVWRPASGRCRLRVAGQLLHADAGDAVLLYARIARPGPPLNPGQYDWGAAERIAGRLAEAYCRDPQCVIVERPAAKSAVAAWGASLRRASENSLRSAVGPRQGDLAAAVIFGARERLPDKTTEAFLRTGTIHLMVVSGLHAGMLAAMAWGVLRLAGCGERARVAGTLTALGAYVLAVGPQAPVVRASVLVAAWLAATTLGRRASAVNVLAAAALAILAMNPAEAFRTGTQLSFVSVATLVGASGVVARRSRRTPLQDLLAEVRPWWERWGRGALRALAVGSLASTAVWIVAGPLVAAKFHIVTVGGVMLTPFLMPLVSAAMGAGLMATTLGWVSPALAAIPGAICAGCLALVQRAIERADAWSWSHAYTAGPSDWWLVGWYVLGGIGILTAPRAGKLPRMIVAAALWGICGFGAAEMGRRAGDQLECTFLAVGHGTCVVMELPGGQTVLYDAGSLNSPESTGRTIAQYLWNRGIRRIDAIVLSHADVDHYNAVPTLLELMPIDAVYVSPMMFDPVATDGRLQAPDYLREQIKLHGAPLREVWMGDKLRLADPRAAIDILFPPREGVYGRDNANSILLSVEFAGRRVLLPGDLESPGIELVMADPPVDCDVLLAPHHGSAASDPPGFAAWCTPEWVVFSGGDAERTAAVDRTYQRAGAVVLHTAASGAVRFSLSAEGVKVAPTVRPFHDRAPTAPEDDFTETPSQ